MNLVFAPQAWEDYLYWQRSDPAILSRVNLLIKENMRDPYTGVGKPEPLKHALQGYWSQRITSEYRIVLQEGWRPTPYCSAALSLSVAADQLDNLNAFACGALSVEIAEPLCHWADITIADLAVVDLRHGG